MPKRIQRKRTKGWRMPEGAVYVGRPTKWGNPFTVEKYGLRTALEYYRAFLTGELAVLPDAARKTYRGYERNNPVAYDIAMMARVFLKGKDLACWCPLDQPCHADVLLEIANA